MAPHIGRTLAGKYRLEALLGEGGMGGVYRAQQVALEKAIAVKVMHEGLTSDPTFVARFHGEAKAASRLDHVNSIRILDFGEEPDGLLYIAMELLDGKTLMDVIEAEAPLSPPRIVGILSQALSALAVAHDMGIIHRDIKPENIMLLRRTGEDGSEEELVKICDFGIAQVTGVPEGAAAPTRAKRGKLTTGGLVIGTPEYMSPEQGRGEALDARTDLYSIGVILYLLLSECTPFDAPTPMGIVLLHQSEEPLPPSSIKPDVDLPLQEVCLKALQKRPADRYGSAREMRSALRAALEQSTRLAPLAAHVVRLGPPGGANARDGGEGRTGPRFVDAVTAAMGAAPSIEERGRNATTASVAAALASPPVAPRWASRVSIVALGLATLGMATGSAWYAKEALARRAPVGLIEVNLSAPSASASAVMAESEPAPLPEPSRTESVARLPLPGPSASPVRGHWERNRSTPPPPSRSSTSEPLPRQLSPPSESPAQPALPIASPPLPAPVVDPSPSGPRAPEEAPAPPPFNVNGARVTAGNATDLMGGVRPSEVNAVVSASMARIEACYRASASAATPQGAWTLFISTDDSGNVERGRLDGPLAPDVKECVSRALRGKVRADTGAVTARVILRFSH